MPKPNLNLKSFDHLRIKPHKSIRLNDFPPDSTRHIPARNTADPATQSAVLRLAELQYQLYTEARRSLLVILQGMDGSGKDGAVRKVFDAVNPTGINVTSFKVPSAEELAHDFFWRCHAKTPPRGDIAVFNRSYYEEVLVVRVHADRLLPPELQGKKDLWDCRYRMINDFEHILTDSGTRVVKFFLHISKDEQKQRFIGRQKDPAKHWKLAAGDFVEHSFWDDYQLAYEKMLNHTSTESAPWYIIPADRKWARNYCMSHIVEGILQDMHPRPRVLADKSLITRKFK